MNAASTAPNIRRSVYAVLIFASAGSMLGRILAVDSVAETAKQEYRIQRELADRRQAFRKQGLAGEKLAELMAAEEARLRQIIDLRRPFLSANDRSRWCTVRALAEEEMRVPGAPYAIDRVIQEPNWDTIDMVKRGDHFYSSKPPLFATLLAGPYWLIYRTTGATLGTHSFEIGRGLLILVNLLPMLLYFFVLARLAERLGTTDWGRVFVLGAAAFGTFLTTFAVVLNNHLLAAVCAAVTLDAAVRIWLDDQPRLRWFFLAGLAAALLVTFELPALVLAALLSLALLIRARRATLMAYLPAALLVAVGFFATNWIAFSSLKPPYLHHTPGDDWYDYTYQRGGRTYQSYWKNPVGIDRGEPSPAVYAVHALVGHHGIFSLTPVWLLSAAGLWTWLRRGDRRQRQLALLVTLTTLVCLAFYFSRPLSHRNYGGMASGLRWMFWLAPLWLTAMLPAADALAASRWKRGVGLGLLTLSVLSAAYPTWNPWTHPWLFDYLYYLSPP